MAIVAKWLNAGDGKNNKSVLIIQFLGCQRIMMAHSFCKRKLSSFASQFRCQAPNLLFWLGCVLSSEIEKAPISFHWPKLETSVKGMNHSLVEINSQKPAQGQIFSPQIGDNSVICHRYSACQPMHIFHWIAKSAQACIFLWALLMTF